MTEPLSESQRRAYLRALGVPVWSARRMSGTGSDAVTAADAAVSPQRAPQPVQSDVAPEAAQIQSSAQDHALADHTTWELLAHQVKRCTQCRLHETRTQSVFGVGARDARLMVVGEAPGAEEDRTGEPFVGRAGKMLNAMLLAIGCERDAVFIANVVKCRPPQNRDPRNDELRQCQNYLQQQMALVQPDVVLAVGRIAAQMLLGSELPLGKLRGVEHSVGESATPLVVTYHPAYLLRTPAQKALAWQDLKRVRSLLDGAL
ncbi:MAG: uracil-DNA glycosylase [Pseudomonadota bacterium]